MAPRISLPAAPRGTLTRDMTKNQRTELINTHRAIESVLEAGLDVAMPLKDDGIDLVCYVSKGDGPWISVAVQVKSRFEIDKKYLSRPGLVMCFVSPEKIYVLTHERAVEIALVRGYLNEDNVSWRDLGGYSAAIGQSLSRDLDSCIATPDRWRAIFAEAAAAPRA